MVGVAAAFAIALGWAILATRLGPLAGFVDAPGADALKVHTRPVPPLGGVGVLAGVHTGMLIEGVFDFGLFVASALVLTLGLIDDRVGLSPRFRLGAEIVTGFLLVGLIDAPFDGPIEFVLDALFVVVAINAVNLLDGLDGLVGSVTVVSGLGLAWIGLPESGGVSFGLVLAAAVAGFLVLNWNPARIFLGDNGAYVIGVFLAYAVVAPSSADPAVPMLVAMGTMGVFFVDLGATFLRRGLNQKPLFAGDRSHLYDQLRDRGWSIRIVAVFAALVQGVFAAVYLGLLAADVGLGIAVLSIGLTAVAVLAVLWKLRFVARAEG